MNMSIILSCTTNERNKKSCLVIRPISLEIQHSSIMKSYTLSSPTSSICNWAITHLYERHKQAAIEPHPLSICASRHTYLISLQSVTLQDGRVHISLKAFRVFDAISLARGGLPLVGGIRTFRMELKLINGRSVSTGYPPCYKFIQVCSKFFFRHHL